MARAKKEAALTPEERLQAALVPDWEWPYKLPENWCWTRHNSIMDIVGGAQPEKAFFIREPKEGYVQLYQTRDYGENPVPVYIPQKYATKTTDEGDILLARYGGSLGKVFRAHKGAYNVALAKVIILYPEVVDDEFLYLYYYSHFYQDFCIKAGYGRSAQAGFNKSDLNELLFPLPPFIEQRRIVERIESLFAKLDEAKEKAQAVVDSFETRKAAILHKAFTGELTAKWRRTHGLSLDTWKEVAADSLFEYVTSGSRGWAKYYDESGAVFIRMGNLDHGTIELDFSDIQHVKLPNKAEGQRSRIRKNDILISITADVGMVGLVRNDDFEGYITQHIALARPVMSESAEFIAWYLVSDIGLKQMQEKQRGATKVGLNLNDIRALQLKIPLIEEQNEILKVIKMWIGKEQQSQEAAEAVLDQIDLMKKSILACAFRGELGTNDPSEESAVELLRQVIEQEDGDVIRPKAKAKRIAIPAEIKPLLSGANEEAIVKLLLKAAPQSVSTQTVMSISKKKFELMDALRNLEKKQIVSKSDSGEYSLVR